MLKELQDFGLSEKEARVYVAALEIGRARADQLAKHSKIVRSTTYVQLESLMKMGLMSTYEEGKKTYFAPESPEYLKRIFEIKRSDFAVKEKELDMVLPELLRQFQSAGDKPLVRFFTGKEGITAMREDTLTLRQGDEIYIMYSLDQLASVYELTELAAYTKKRVSRGIKVRSIYTKGGGPLPREDITPLTERRYLPPEKMPLSSDFFIYQNKIAIMALRGNIFGVIIESKEIADSFRVLFNLLWGITEAE